MTLSGEGSLSYKMSRQGYSKVIHKFIN